MRPSVTEERILIVQLRQLGDILLTTPCLRAIKRERPRARLTFLSHRMGRLVLDDCPFLDEHFFYDDQWTWREEWRLAKTLRERKYDLVFDFMNNPRSAFYTLRSGAKRRIAFRSARRLAYTDLVEKPAAARYIVDEKFELLRAAGMTPPHDDPELGRPVLPWFEGHTRPLMKLWAEQPLFKTAPLIVAMSPTHRREPRRWPLQHYAALADRLVERHGALVFWLWGPGEEDVADRALALSRQSTHKAPKTSFREMAALIANCHLFIGNSNGPSHVAVAGNVPSLQLHGPTLAASWCPSNERHHAIQAPELSLLAVDDVFTEVERMLPFVRQEAVVSRQKRPKLTWRA